MPTTAIPVNRADWSDLSHLKLPSNYKEQSLEVGDQNALFAVYKSLYSEQSADRKAMAESIKKCSSVIIGSQSYSSKLECRSLHSERIYASWAAADQEALVFIHLIFCWSCPLLRFAFHYIKWEVCATCLPVYCRINLMKIPIDLEIRRRPKFK